MNAPAPRAGPVPRGRLRAIALALAVVVLVAAGAWFARAPLLTGLAQLWIVSDAPEPADAIVVLGGGLETRPFAAADYYRRGLARKILVSDVRQSRTERLGIFESHYNQNRRVLAGLGVPDAAVEALGAANLNTREESLALRAWVERNRASVVLVPTEIFSARRVRWTLGRALAGSGARAVVPAIESEQYGRENWWREDLGLIAFQNEVLKYLYYRLKYRD